MMLSPNFSLAELTISEFAAHMEIDNTPGPAALANLHRLAIALEKVRAWLGRPVIIRSGYRSPGVNKGVGGARKSAHLTGLAADYPLFEHLELKRVVCDQRQRAAGVGIHSGSQFCLSLAKSQPFALAVAQQRFLLFVQFSQQGPVQRIEPLIHFFYAPGKTKADAGSGSI